MLRKNSLVTYVVSSLLTAFLVVEPNVSCAGPPQPEGVAGKANDWAENYLREDSPALIAKPSLEDLQRALQNPALRDLVIERHFARANLTASEQREFLRQSLGHESLAVRQQTAIELKKLGWLNEVVGDMLLELAKRDDVELQRAVVIALQYVELPATNIPEHYWKAVLAALNSDDPLAQNAASFQLERWGPASVPKLLDELRTAEPQMQREIARVLARVVANRPLPAADGREPSEFGAPSGAPPSASPTPRVMTPLNVPGKGTVTVPKAAGPEYIGPRVGRALEAQQPRKVRVYFGTNRSVVGETPDPRFRLWLLPAVFLGAIASVYWRLRPHAAVRRSGVLTALVVVISLGIGSWSLTTWNSALHRYLSEHIGVDFGPHRDPDSVTRFGQCDVTIPPTHQVGEVEQPWIGRENEYRHVTLQQTDLLGKQQFVDAVHGVLNDRPAGARDCFIFVHGFNVSFEAAALRTAQIYYDLKFQGAPLFYSWPSRGNLRSYFSDRNEIGCSTEHIKEFLLLAADRLDADRIHVIAHSMGAEGVSRAIATMGEQSRKFDQIVLAAPDIDAGLFREQLAPRIVERSQRTTLYCSRSDLALHASYAFNDSPRIGDSSRAIVVVKNIDTVDASEIDTDLLGHSYYGDCLPLLRDVGLLFDRNFGPAERDLHPNYLREELAYWTFRQLMPGTPNVSRPGP